MVEQVLFNNQARKFSIAQTQNMQIDTAKIYKTNNKSLLYRKTMPSNSKIHNKSLLYRQALPSNYNTQSKFLIITSHLIYPSFIVRYCPVIPRHIKIPHLVHLSVPPQTGTPWPLIHCQGVIAESARSCNFQHAQDAILFDFKIDWNFGTTGEGF